MTSGERKSVPLAAIPFQEKCTPNAWTMLLVNLVLHMCDICITAVSMLCFLPQVPLHST